MHYNIVLIGPPACGKGTQGAQLAKLLSIPSIKPGVLYREHIAQGTELGKIAEEYVAKGDLLPDSYTNELIKKELENKDISKGIILDGYPRSMGQVHALEGMLKLDFVFFFNVSDATVKKRIAVNERGRGDDSPEVVQHRLDIYHANYDKIIEYYRDKDFFYELDGEQEIEAVFRDILDILKK